MGRPKCGKPLTLLLGEMNLESQPDDEYLKTLISNWCKHTEVINHLIDYYVGKR